MGFLDRAKEAAQRAKSGARVAREQGQQRIEDLQARRQAEVLLREVGLASYEEHRGEGGHEAVVRAVAKLDEHVRTYNIDLSTSGIRGYLRTAAGSGPGADATTNGADASVTSETDAEDAKPVDADKAADTDTKPADADTKADAETKPADAGTKSGDTDADTQAEADTKADTETADKSDDKDDTDSDSDSGQSGKAKAAKKTAAKSTAKKSTSKKTSAAKKSTAKKRTTTKKATQPPLDDGKPSDG